MESFGNIDLRLLHEAEEMQAVETLESDIWEGSRVVPAHLLIAIAHSGGIIIGAYDNDDLVGFVFSFPGLDANNAPKQSSHMLAVAPTYQNRGIGFALKRAQWQMTRKQGLELVTWTFDPLMSKNAHLNIIKLGAISKTYIRNIYGSLKDGINAGIPTDRFLAEWWVNSSRVSQRLERSSRRPLSLKSIMAAGAILLNSSSFNEKSWPVPSVKNNNDLEVLGSEQAPVVLVEIPADFPALKNADMELALSWRSHTRIIFERLFDFGYIVTDFTFEAEEQARSFYLLSNGEAKLGF